MKRINMAAPFFTIDDRKRIHKEIDVILDGALSMGPNVHAFEEEFANYVGVRHAIAMNSCTSTLEAALHYFSVKDREVIIPAETFIATGMAVHLAGGIPVFAEISADTFCLDIIDVKRRITPKTAGIIIVHMAGLITPDIFEFKRFCDEQGLFLIEDAAHSPGACVEKQKAGSFGNIGCFSFFPTKVITAGEGGMLTTNDDEIANFARSFQHRGRDMISTREQYSHIGRNVRMTETAALLGRVQLGHLDEYLERRRRIAKIYLEEFSNQQDLCLIIPKEIESSSFWKVPILIDEKLDRTVITEQMAAANVAVDWAYQPPVHLQPVFKELYGFAEGMLPITEGLLKKHICLPCHPQMSDVDAKYVSATLIRIIKTIKSNGAES